MDSNEVKIGEWFKEGFNLYQNNFLILFLTNILALLLSLVSIGILLGPMLVGYFLIALRLLRKDDPKPGLGDLFAGFDYFLQSLIFVIGFTLLNFIGTSLLGILPLIGGLLSTAFKFVFPALFMFGFPLIADRKLEAFDAAKQSYEKVKEQFIPFIGYGVLASVAGGAGALLFGVGMLLTLPIYLCCIAVAYEKVFGQEKEPVENVSTTMAH